MWSVLRRHVPVGRGAEGVELVPIEALKPRPCRVGDGVPVAHGEASGSRRASSSRGTPLASISPSGRRWPANRPARLFFFLRGAAGGPGSRPAAPGLARRCPAKERAASLHVCLPRRTYGPQPHSSQKAAAGKSVAMRPSREAQPSLLWPSLKCSRSAFASVKPRLHDGNGHASGTPTHWSWAKLARVGAVSA